MTLSVNKNNLKVLLKLKTYKNALKVFAQAFFKKLVDSKGKAFGRSRAESETTLSLGSARGVNFDEVKRGELCEAKRGGFADGEV